MSHKGQQAAPTQSAGDLSPWTDPTTSTLLGNDLMDKCVGNNEPLKKVCSNSRSSALWHFILFHLPAMLVTLTLLILHVTNIRWDPSHPTADERAALQFAAKAHESLILISLTDILLHRIRYGLLGRNGVPLGFLSSPFNISFSVRYLISQEFWSPALNPTAKRLFTTVTAAMVLLFALLGLAAGPSSAIAMIPLYDWWEIPSPRFSSGYSAVVEQDPYTMKFESQHIPKYKTCGLVDNQTCVNQNLSMILQTLKPLISLSEMGPETIRLGNVSAPSSSPPYRPITLSQATWDSETSFMGQLAYAVTPMDFISETLGIDTDMIEMIDREPPTLMRSEALKLSGKEKWKQPLVAVHCSEVRWQPPSIETSLTFGFEERLYENLTVSLGINDTLDLLKSTPENIDDEYFHPLTTTILDIQHLLPAPISASMLFTFSFMDANYSTIVQSDNVTIIDGDNVPTMDINLCLVQARWVEADVWLYPKESLEIRSHLGFPLSDAMQYMRQKSDNHEVPIEMTDKWLRDIGVPPNSASTRRENPAYRQGLNFCGGKSDFYPSSCVTSFLAVYLANALSHSTDIKGDFETGRSPDPNSTVINNTYFEHIYAYGFRESTIILLAFTALLIPAFIALIHLALTVFARQPWLCFAWGDIGQLLTLALRSKASDELYNAGAGVQRSQTWKLVTVVREIGEGGQLEMAVCAPMTMPRRGQGYAGVEEQEAI
ncbi:hypothetical protein Forpe1208_v014510 [Fusarium oxysporum f. sp. rapae]|uniref:Uncharacterized protein n=1 Tax=Fusarium oxysporum f. sp. rapae TaxID=485398 RepID=A0A8J5TQK2_FUSOX|nr:hypothetical protein Forpe1208_v014510 [Fusarium oxysporum f. sp. rapae]